MRLVRFRSSSLFWLAAGVACGLVWAFATWMPAAWDYRLVFRPAVWGWLRGASYSDWPGFWNPPWTLLFLLPFAILPDAVGQAALQLFTMTVMLLALRGVRRWRLAVPFVLFSLPGIALYWVGQIEVFSLLGVLLGAWAVRRRRPWMLSLALTLLMNKPQEVLLMIPFLLWSVRRWRLDEWLRVLVGPAAAMALAFVLFGTEWIRVLAEGGWRHSAGTGWTNIAVWWRMFGQASRPVALACSAGSIVLGVWLLWARPLNRYTVALAVTVGIVASSYVTDNYLVLLLVLAWPVLLDESPGWATVCYAATLSPLARWTGSATLSWLDGVFPLVTLIGLLSMYRRSWTTMEAEAER